MAALVTTESQQSLGGGAAIYGVYSSTTALSLESRLPPVGSVAFVQSNPPTQYQAFLSAPVGGQTFTTSTVPAVLNAVGTTVQAAQTVYWVPFNGSTGAQSASFVARAVVMKIGAYAGTGTGTLTASVVGAVGNANGLQLVDSVTPVVGDQIFIPAGLTHVTAVDSGPWTVVVVGSASAKYVLTRPWWWFTGNTWTSGQTIKIGGEGAIYANTAWVATAAAGVIDTTDSAFYCKEITFQVTIGGTGTGYQTLSANQPSVIANYPLTAGTASASACPIGLMANAGSGVAPAQTVQCLWSMAAVGTGGGAPTGAIAYGPLVPPTAGYVGTASIIINSIKTLMVVNTNADTSTVNITLRNPC